MVHDLGDVVLESLVEFRCRKRAVHPWSQLVAPAMVRYHRHVVEEERMQHTIRSYVP